MQLGRRTSDLALSVTLALDARAKELIASGRDIVNMAVGEPDFAAPAAASRAAVAKVESGTVKYTPAAGTPSLRAAVAAHLTETRGTPFASEEVVVCHSAKHALSGVLMVLLDPGDELLIPLPAWVSYMELTKVTGAKPVCVPPRSGCRPDLDALAKAVTPRTRALLMNSPCNPSGYVWTPEEIEAVSRFANEHDLWLISDEIYRRLVYEGPANVSPASVDAATRARTIVVDGASKAYSMTGYRIGYAAGPTEVIRAMVKLHSQMTGAPNAVSQAAFEAVLTEEPPEVETMVREFAARRTFLLGELGRLGLETPEPRGAFYAFPDVTPHLDERGSVGFCEDLLEQQGLCIVPGAAFGLDHHVRFSYALGLDRIEEAVRRMDAFLGAAAS